MGKEIFTETDDDGDTLTVVAGGRYAYFRSQQDNDRPASVRLDRGSAERLRDALNEWLGTETPTVVPEPVTDAVSAPVDPVRLAALDAAVRYSGNHLIALAPFAAEIEAYLRGGVVEAEEAPDVRPPACQGCGHAYHSNFQCGVTDHTPNRRCLCRGES